jgi:uncharacterized protein YceK
MTSPLPRLLTLALALLVAACGAVDTKRSPREETLYGYASAVRWSDFEAAKGFLDPDTVSARPVTDFEMERYKQFQVAGYEVRSAKQDSPEEFEQVVEMRVVNRNTLVEKVLTDKQRWRWDEEAKRWWLISGLPKLESRR